MSILQSIPAFHQVNSDDDNDPIPFGRPSGACRGTGLADEMFAGYTPGVVARALDRISDDMDALDDEPERADLSYYESGAEMAALDRATSVAAASALLQLPDGSDLVIRQERTWRTWHHMKRCDSWHVTVITPVGSVGLRVREVGRIARAVVAKWNRKMGRQIETPTAA